MTRKLKAYRNALELLGIDEEHVTRVLRRESCCDRRGKSREDRSWGTIAETPARRRASYAAHLLFERELRHEADSFARSNRYAAPVFVRQGCKKAMPIQKMRKNYV